MSAPRISWKHVPNNHSFSSICTRCRCSAMRVNPNNALRTFKLHPAMLSNDAADPPHKYPHSIARNCYESTRNPFSIHSAPQPPTHLRNLPCVCFPTSVSVVTQCHANAGVYIELYMCLRGFGILWCPCDHFMTLCRLTRCFLPAEHVRVPTPLVCNTEWILCQATS